MKKSTLIISWMFYFLGFSFLSYELGFRSEGTVRWTYLSLASMALLVPWVICIIHAFKTKSINIIWLFFLFSFSSVAVPIYLLSKSKVSE